MTRRELIKEAGAAGWTVTLRPGGHLMLTHPLADRAVFTSATPSDWRSYHNTMAELRRALPPEPKPERPAEPRSRRLRPAHRPEPIRSFGPPLPVHRIAGPVRRQYLDAPEPRRALPGGPAGYRSSLDR